MKCWLVAQYSRAALLFCLKDHRPRGVWTSHPWWSHRTSHLLPGEDRRVWTALELRGRVQKVRVDQMYMIRYVTIDICDFRTVFWEGAFGRKRVSAGLHRTEQTDQTRRKWVRKPSSYGIWLPAKRLWVETPITADNLCASLSRTLNQSCSLRTWITNKSWLTIPMQMHIPNAKTSHTLGDIWNAAHEMMTYELLWVWVLVRGGIRGENV